MKRPEDIYFLVGCEESQAITIELRKIGVNAFSCDLKPCSGGHPEWHIQGDVFDAINRTSSLLQNGDYAHFKKWDAAVFHPDCTYLTVSANKWYKDQPERKSGVLVGARRREAREKAIKFFMNLYNCGIPNIRIENPICVMSSRFRKPDQVLQPWMFGMGETKATCLWNLGFPNVKSTNIVEGRKQALHLLPPSKDRAELRSKTYQGIAEAIAKQSVEFLISQA